jgi:hypothetical protein
VEEHSHEGAGCGASADVTDLFGEDSQLLLQRCVVGVSHDF